MFEVVEQVAAVATNDTLRMQLEALLQTTVPITLSKAALSQRNGFSCGSSQVVKFNAYKDFRVVRFLDMVLPEKDVLISSREDKIFNECAVVGNSGTLLEGQAGPEIDSHDVVIRFNQGALQSFAGRGPLPAHAVQGHACSQVPCMFATVAA